MTPFGYGSPPSDHARDPYTTLRALAHQRACHFLADGHQWLIADPSAVTALVDHEALSLPTHNGLMDLSLTYRQQVVPWLRRFMATTHVKVMQLLTARLMDERLDLLARQDEADLIFEFAGWVPAALMCRLLGLGEADIPIVQRLVNAIQGNYDLSSTLGTPEVPGAEAFLRQLVARRIKAPCSDEAAPLLEGLRELWSKHPSLTTESLLDTCTKLLTAGTATVTGVLGNLLDDLFLGHESPNPEILLTAVATPLGQMRTCEMVVRVHTPVLVLKRDVHQAFKWNGHRFAKGQRLLLVVPTVIAGPRRLLHALADDTVSETDGPNEVTSTRKNLAFGYGDQYCLGAPLARLQISQLLQRAPQLLSKWRRGSETIWRPAWLLHEPLHLSLIPTEA
jgi:cytochrome P450